MEEDIRQVRESLITQENITQDEAKERYMEGKRLVDEKTIDTLKRLPQPNTLSSFDDDLERCIIIDGIRLEKKT